MGTRRFKISGFNFLYIIIVVVITLSVLVAISAPAQAKDSLDLRVVGIGARSLGMGKAGVALADDSNAVFINPAGLAYQKNWSATCMSTKLMERVDYKLVAGTYHTDYGTFGIGYIGATTPGGYLTTNKASMSSAVPIGYGSSQIIVSYARSLNELISGTSILGDLSLGVSAKVLANNFSGYSAAASGQSCDFALLFKPRKNISFGLNLMNLGGNVNWANGSSEDLASKSKVGTVIKLLDDKLLLAVDADLAIIGNSPLLIHGGLEWTPLSLIVLRAGLDQSALGSSAVTNLTGGLGIKLAGFSFDYAYQQDSKLSGNSSHYFSLSFQPTFVEEIAAKEIKSELKVAGNQTNSNNSFGVLTYYK